MIIYFIISIVLKSPHGELTIKFVLYCIVLNVPCTMQKCYQLEVSFNLKMDLKARTTLHAFKN